MRCGWVGSWRRGDGDGRRGGSLGGLASRDGGRVRRRTGVDEWRMFESEHVEGGSSVAVRALTDGRQQTNYIQTGPRLDLSTQ